MSEQQELDYTWPAGSYEHYRPFLGKVVRCTVPVEWWSDDWHRGMRERVYVGRVCSHHNPLEGAFCLQPHRHQGIESPCFPLTPEMRLEVLPGNAKDY
jgi:hypothetical protein